MLFADVVGSTDLGARHDPEAYRRVLMRYFDRAEAIVTEHGGTVEKFIGDAVMAVFGLPTVHEDDALRAVRAAVAFRDEVARIASEAPPDGVTLAWRLGVNTGEVLVGGSGGRTLATGDAVNVAARLEQAAGPGELLLGEATHALVRDAVDAEALPPLQVRGKTEPVAAYRVRSVDTRAAGHARRFDLPFVGREAELDLITWTVARSLATHAPQLLSVYGDAGVGKTRLVTTALGRAPVRTLYGRCLPYGDGVTYWPITEALTTAAGVRVGDTAEVTHAKLDTLVGGRVSEEVLTTTAATTGLTDEVLALEPEDALLAYLGALAEEGGLALVVDDLHDAEPPLLELLTRLGRARSGAVVVCAITRPDLLEREPFWAGGVPSALSFQLGPLDDVQVARIIDDRLEGPVDARLVDRLVTAAAGNVLYLEELVAALIEDRSIRRGRDGRWRLARPDAPLAPPASIHLLLAARIDRLDPADRALLGRAAVCGERFTLDALTALSPEHEPGDVAARADALVDRDLLRPTADGYEFRHRFLRDAVYAGLPRRVRAELHERHATRLEAAPPTPRVDEFVVLHLERALEERNELDPTDARSAELRARVADRAAEAGSRALVRGDMPTAVRLLGHALDRLPDHDPRRVGLLSDRGRALAEGGDFRAADAELRLAITAAEEDGDPRARMHTLLSSVWVRSNLDLDGWADEADQVCDEALAVFDADDHGGLGRAWGLRAEVHFLRGRYADALAAMRRAEAHAEEAGERTEAHENAVAGAFVLPLGPWPVDEALARCDELLERFADEPGLEARVLQVAASLRAMRGDATAARAALAVATERFTELGQRYWSATCSLIEGHVEHLLDAPEQAAAAFGSALATFDEMGDRAQAAVVAATLASGLPTSEVATIAELTDRARRDAAPDDVDAQVRLRLAEVRLASVTGDLAAARASALEAVRVAGTTDGPVLQADAALALARVLTLTGAPADAAQAAASANAAYARKGHTVGIDRVARLAVSTSAGTPRAGAPG